MRLFRRFVVGGLAATAVLLAAAPAGAHVGVDPDEVPKGGFAIVSFTVPNERDDSATIGLEVQFPEDHPIAFASVEPIPGWTAEVEVAELAEPVEVHGEEVTEAVSTITWTADGAGIQPGEFQRFPVSMGPLPEDVDELVFPSVQTYDSGEPVRWIQETPEGGEEPENPAPVLGLTDAEGGHGDEEAAASDDATATADDAAESADADDGDDDDSTELVAVVALVLGAVGAVAGIGAFVRGRRVTP
jgi:uncharacterized protein YcnI